MSSVWVVAICGCVFMVVTYALGRDHGRRKAERAFAARWATYHAFQSVLFASMLDAERCNRANNPLTKQSNPKHAN